MTAKADSRKYHGDVRDKTFSVHVMPENCADVSKSAVFTHVRSQGYMVNANISEIEATSGRDPVEPYSSAANSLMTFWPNFWYQGRAIQSSRVTSCDASMSFRKMALLTFAAVTS